MTVSFPLDGYERPALGVRGGSPGSLAVAQKIDRDGSVRDLPHVVREQLVPGERIRGLMNGGGGFGDPLERDPSLVLDDVRSGYVSVVAAQRCYGVVVTELGGDVVVDSEATARRRRARPPGRVDGGGQGTGTG